MAAVALRLNSSILSIGAPCNVCTHPMTDTTEHAMLCTMGAPDKARHDAVRDVIKKLSKKAHLNPRMEVYRFFPGTKETGGCIFFVI